MGVSTGESPDRLDSWKAIADYLDRDVATVRRWEKSLGLPIRRVPGGPGRSVFAFRNEIDEWLKGAPLAAEPVPAAAPPAGSGLDPALGTDESADPIAASSPSHRWRWPLAAAAVVVVVGGLLWKARTPSAEGSPPTVTVTGAAVVSSGPDGTERWRFPFRPDARAIPIQAAGVGAVTPISGQVPGYLVGVAYSEAIDYDSKRAGELLWLTRDGALHRRFSFEDRVQFRHDAYEGPWVIADYRVDPSETDGRVAVAAHHMQWWPSIVTLLDRRWQRSQTFVNAGWVERVQWLRGDRLLIAGFFNGLDGGMVALLDAAAMNGRSPSVGDPRFDCLSCGASMPLRYVVFPRSEINLVTASTFNRAMVETTRGQIVVRTIEEPKSTGQAAEALYEFSPDLTLRSASYGDRYWDAHKALEMAGRLDHSRERCPERDGPRVIHVWTPRDGWQKVPVR